MMPPPSWSNGQPPWTPIEGDGSLYRAFLIPPTTVAFSSGRVTSAGTGDDCAAAPPTDAGRHLGRGDHDAVIRVRGYLEEHYASKITLTALAGLAGLNVFHLIRVFRASTGLPPYAYLKQIRVNRAAALLRKGHSVSRVAFLTGFADQSHLTRFFKRLVGVPPGVYQRSALRAQP